MSRVDVRLPLAERYRPHRLADLLGSARLREDLRAWATAWAEGKVPARRALLLVGPPGVGKTSAALAIAEEFGWTLVEMNASDARNESAIEQVAGRASITQPLDATGPRSRASHSLILLDEADCLTGRLPEGPRASPAPPTLQEFLRGRYGTIDALLGAWGLREKRPPPFETWDDVPRSPGRAGWARAAAAQRDLADWKGGSRPRDLTDRGGLGAISRLVRSTRQPLVLTVNDERPLQRYSPVFRTGLLRVRIAPLRDAEVRGQVDSVARKEDIALGPGAAEAIVRRARGDLRAALNDLEAIAPLGPGPAQLSVLAVRDLTSDLTELTEEALTTPRFYRSVEVQDRVDAPPDDLLPWIDENIPGFAPDARHRAAAFDVLSVADRFLFRARRARVWSQWSYASELLTGGVGLALHDAPSPDAREAYFPRYLGEMGRSRFTRGLRDGIAKKAGAHFHLSVEKGRVALMPFLEAVFLQAAGPRPSDALPAARSLAGELELTAEEVGFLARLPAESPRVAAILEAPRTEPPTGSPDPTPEGSEAASPAPRRVQRSLSEFGR